MTPMKKKRCTILALLLVCATAMKAQEDTTESRCIVREELIRMIHLQVSDVHSTELMDLLDAKDYQLGSNVEMLVDTIQGLPLRYRCNVYYDKVEGRLVPAVQTCESMEGLSNIIRLELDRRHTCDYSYTADFRDAGYLYDGKTQTYSGHDGMGTQEGIYAAQYEEDSATIRMTIRFQSEAEQYIERKIAEYQARVDSALLRAERMTNLKRFSKAYAILDSTMGEYAPLDHLLADIASSSGAR